MKAQELLRESNAHMTHLEDLLLEKGYDGAVDAINYAESVRQMLAKGTGNPSKVTVKWDGSPAVFAGVDPSDGKFFVGTKSVLAKTPKYVKSPADVKKYYSDKPELAKKLLAAYKFLRKLGITDVLQGDLMFTEGDVKEEKIDGEPHLTFTPNTITYAVPKNSELGKKIARAKLGVVFHTEYEPAESLRDTEVRFGANVSGLNNTPDVWVDDATYKDYTGIVSLTPQENKLLTREITAATKRLKRMKKSKIDKIIANEEFSKNIQPFINQRVRQGAHVGDSMKFTRDFINFYAERVKKGMEKLTPKFQEKREQKAKEAKDFIEKNAQTIYEMLDLYKHLNEIKLLLVDKLNTLDSVKTFVQTENGYEVTDPEGFVAIGHDGNAVKLVNRLEFSRQNFLRHAQ